MARASGAERRDFRTSIRLSKSEKTQIDAACIMLGVKFSEYMRAPVTLPIAVVERAIEDKRLFDEQGEHAYFVVYDKYTFNALHSQLRAWGRHYIQAVHALNKVQARRNMATEEAQDLIDKAKDLLEDIDEYREQITESIKRIERSELLYLEW